MLCSPRGALVCAVCALVSWSPDVCAESPPSVVVHVTWAQVASLVRNHPEVAASRLRIEAARGAKAAAREFSSPSVSGALGQGRAKDGSEVGLEWNLELDLPLDWISAWKAKQDAAQANIERARAERDVLERNVLAQLGALFWTVAAQQSEVALLEQMEQQTQQLMAAVQARIDKGAARPAEGTRIAIELDKIASDLSETRTALEAHAQELGLWLGLPEGSSVLVVADIYVLPTPDNLDIPASELRDSHPANAVAKAQRRVQEARLNIARRARIPTLAVFGYANGELDRNGVGGGLRVELPLWMWNNGTVVQERALTEAQSSQFHAELLALQSQFIAAQAECRADLNTAKRLRDSTVPKAQSLASSVQRAYELGEVGLLELLDARTTLLGARRLYVNSLSKAHVDCSRLEALAGEETP